MKKLHFCVSELRQLNKAGVLLWDKWNNNYLVWHIESVFMHKRYAPITFNWRFDILRINAPLIFDIR